MADTNPTKIIPNQFKLGDTLKISDGAFMTATVVKEYSDRWILLRPYVHTSDSVFAASNPHDERDHNARQVYSFLGWEEVSVWKSSSAEWELLGRVPFLR